ncbi:MAG: transcriptional repressor [Chlamydiae bacterium]|nr:transcriptional repressor [Chlamydiota bacterium]
MKRETRQKQAIAEVFSIEERPLSIQEILEAASKFAPNLSLATVYRNLKILVEQGVIKSVEIPGHASRYERADLEQHSHFFCEKCDKVFDVMYDLLSIPKRLVEQFEVQRHNCILYGCCKSCK